MYFTSSPKKVPVSTVLQQLHDINGLNDFFAGPDLSQGHCSHLAYQLIARGSSGQRAPLGVYVVMSTKDVNWVGYIREL